jgi:pSer/pThr/pTyr-binding forkhead associated (FHA) protein
MAHIRLDDNEIELNVGELRIGTDEDAGVRLEGDGEKNLDGREYEVAAAGLRIGRDASSDIVASGADVSRHHAQISRGPSGHVVRDLSANGVFVNDTRTGDAHPLRRGDVIRIGTEEFRFYADQVPPPAAQAAGLEPPTPVPDVEVPLATLEVVNEGTSKGKRYEIRRPLAHVDRGPHNDVVVMDASISDVHAKLQRRDSVGFVVDMDSTNGTYVAGRRIRGECALESTAAVRFGGLKAIFRATPPEVVEAEGGTRMIVGLKLSDQQCARAARPVVATRQAEARDSTGTTRGVSALVCGLRLQQSSARPSYT